MIVFGTKQNEDTGTVIFRGTMEDCERYIKGLSLEINDYRELTICENDGKIAKWIIG